MTARVGHHIVLFALLMNFLSATLLSVQNADAFPSVQNGEQSYVLCTSRGLKRITLDENGNPVENPEDIPEHCVYCLPFYQDGGGLLSPQFDFPVLDIAWVQSIPAWDVFPQPLIILDKSCPPRGPPLTMLL